LHLISGIMKVKSFKGGYDDNFCYLIWDAKTLEGAIIDPSVMPDIIFEFIDKNNIQLSKILITHTHYDHISYLSDFLSRDSNLIIYSYINTRQSLGNNFKGVKHYDRIFLGDKILTVLYTPGHYDDSVCYFEDVGKILFTGDTVFVGRSGRTISKHSDVLQLYDSIYNIILKLPEDTLIYPGHDYGDKPVITISENIKLSSFFSCKSVQEFTEVMKNFESNR